VHEQVANKLSVQFADIGAQEVKNIPTPVQYGGDAARGRNLRNAAIEEAAAASSLRNAELDVARGGDAGMPHRDRRRRFSVFHQDRDAGGTQGVIAGQQ
jgi:hypothetical protein